DTSPPIAVANASNSEADSASLRDRLLSPTSSTVPSREVYRISERLPARYGASVASPRSESVMLVRSSWLSWEGAVAVRWSTDPDTAWLRSRTIAEATSSWYSRLADSRLSLLISISL